MGMFAYRTPGVRFEWLDTSPQGIEPVRTDIAGFAGFAERGPLHQAVKVESWNEYTSTFGGFIAQGYLAYAVYGFFANGGRTCYVVRVTNPAQASAAFVDVPAETNDAPVLTLTGATPGVWAAGLMVTVQRQGAGGFGLTVQLGVSRQERFKYLTLQAPAETADARGTRIRGAGAQASRASGGGLKFVEAAVNDGASGSRLIYATVHQRGGSSLPRPGVYVLAGGADALDSICVEHWYGRGFVPAPCAAVIPTTVTIAPPSPSTALSPGPQAVPARVITSPADTVGAPPDAARTDAKAAPSPCPPAAVGSALADPCAQSDLQRAEDLTRPWGFAVFEQITDVNVLIAPDLAQHAEGLEAAGPRCSPAPEQSARRPICQPPYGSALSISAPSAERADPRALNDGEIRLVQDEMVAQCERLKNRMVLLDVPRPAMTPTEAIAWRDQTRSSSYATIYYPWLRVPDDLRLGGQLLRAVPPSGHVAGIYARIDNTVGVQKPPANELLDAAQDVTVAISDSQYGDLNVSNVNAVKTFPGRGLRVAGARTLSDDGGWRFVNVRRLLLMIEASLIQQTEWLVFEPNDPELWRRVDRVVRAFLDGLWRAGALDGASADDAYLVQCDEVTNPQVEIDQGRMLCLLGVQPPWPAEFVIARIGRVENAMQVVAG